MVLKLVDNGLLCILRVRNRPTCLSGNMRPVKTGTLDLSYSGMLFGTTQLSMWRWWMKEPTEGLRFSFTQEAFS